MSALINLSDFGTKIDTLNTNTPSITACKFSVTRTVNQTIKRSRIYTKIEWNHTIFDTNYDFDTTNTYAYKAPQSGYYLFNLSVRGDGRLPGTYSTYGIKIGLFINNVINNEVFVGYNTVPSINYESCVQPTLSHVLRIEKNDIVDCRVYIDSDTNNQNIRCDKKYTFFSGHFLTL